MGCVSSSVFKAGIQVAAAVAPVPGLGPAADLLAVIVDLCESVPQNRNAAVRLADRCRHLYNALKQFEKKSVPDRMVAYLAAVFKCFNKVKDTMQKWSEKSWYHMLVYQGDFEAEFEDCNTAITDCLTIFTTAAHMETLVNQKADEKWKRDLKESQDADHKAIMDQLAAANFMQRVMESKLMENQNEIKAISIMMQKGLAERAVVSEEGRKRMAINLYELLRLSNLAPPECQLDSGEVEWSGEVPIEGGKNVDMYKGRYLQSQDVRIKVIRSVNMKDEKTVERIRREVQLWAEIFRMDKGKHVIPFYGFFTPDGFRLALVSPWIDNGNALDYVKKNDKLVNYKKLIITIAEGIKVLHSTNPPIIHGNLRAEKVLIGDEGQPLITDFALAKLEGNPITQTTGESDSCRWSAPEMFEDQAVVSAKGDVYSFGMTILQLFTHEKPYSDIHKTFQVYSKKQERNGLPDRPRDERVVERGLDDGMWGLLYLCWSRDPNDRPSIDDLVTKLSNLS